MGAMRAICLIVALSSVHAAELPRPDDPTHFTPADKQAMLQLARRVAATRGDVAFSPDHMPAKLLRSTGRPLLLSAHRPGAEPLVAVAAKGSLFEQIKEAARQLRATGRLVPLPAFRFKIDIIEATAAIGPGITFGSRGHPALGIHGIHLRSPDEEFYLPPSEALRLDLPNGEAFVRHALRRAKAPSGGLRDVVLERFDAISFIEREPGGAGPPVDLYRGMPLVERVTRRKLLAACGAAADWLLRFQKPDGSFHYSYNAATEKVDNKSYNIVRHAGTAWSLAQAHAALRQRRFKHGAYRALEWLLSRARTRDKIAWIEHGGRCALGAAALGLVALLEYRSAAATKRFDKEIKRLGRFLVLMQRDDGFFWSDYDPKGRRGFVPKGHVPLYAPGEAFLALVRLQRALPDLVWRRAAAKAADFAVTKRDAWYVQHDLPMVHPDAWTMMGLDEFHALGAARRVHVDYCFFLAEQILEEQEAPATARWRDHVGAPRASTEPPRVAPAAARCEGLVAAWRLARRMGVAAAGYRRAILRSARFQLAHQYDAVNSYLLPNPRRALGGFYSSYGDHRIRIDFVQHNISALLGAAEMLQAEKDE